MRISWVSNLAFAPPPQLRREIESASLRSSCRLRSWLHRGPLLVSLLVSGCAVRYSDLRAGTERLWGIAQLGTRIQEVNQEYVSVIVGSRAPGVCFDIGRANLGITLGLLNRQRLMIIKKEDWSDWALVATSRGLSLR